jgi:T5SS/PEP-CTERM-associated repeat protein
MSNDAVSIIGNQSTTVVDGNSSLISAGNGNDNLTAGTNSIVVAGNGADNITVGAGSVVVAGNGSDTIVAGANSLVTAGNGSDKITVGANSAIVVGNGNDTLTAGSNSLITAGNGNDTIYLGQSDLVIVGNGSDKFVLPASAQVSLTAPTSVAVNEDGTVALSLSASSSGFGFGNETILGFNTSKDVIQFNTSQFANFAAVMASAKQVGNDVVITGDATDTIDLSGVHLSSLSASDFSFVNTSNITVTISGIPAGVTLSDTAGALTVTNGSVTLTQAQLAGLTLKAGEVTAGTLTVTATDTSTGNSVSKTIALSINPVAPTLTGPQSLTVGSGSSVALGITETPFDPRDTISVTIKGVPSDATLSAGTKNADGSWTLTSAQLTDLALKAGDATETTLTVTATNTAGQTASVSETIQLNVVTALKVTFDTVSYTDTGVQGDHITNNPNVTLSGTVTDNLTTQAQVYNAGTLLGTASVDNVHHTWSLTTTLADGTYDQLSVKATDSASTTASASTTQYVQIDTTAPMLNSQSESIAGLTQSKSDVITVQASDAVGVTSVAIYDDATHQLIGNATPSNGNTVWTYNASGLADGAHQFYAVITDSAGNQTQTTDLATVTVDTTPPTATISVSAPGPTSATTEVITVDATDANGVASVAIKDGTTVIGNATQSSNGVWTYTASNLAQGSHDFTAVVTDNAGNSTTTDHSAVLVDTTAPSVTFDAVSYDHTGAANFTNDGAVTLSGTTSDNVTVSQVQVFSDGQFLGNAVVDNTSHTWTLTDNLTSGVYTNFSATATDEAGNTANAVNTSTTQALQVDQAPPSVTFGTVSYIDTGTQNDGITGNNVVTMSGSVNDNVTVSQVQVFNGSQLLGNALVDNNSHTWTLTTNLADGTYANLTATATDEAGNTASGANASATTSLQIDTAPPAVTFNSVVLTHPTDSSGTASTDGGITLSGTVSDNISVSEVQVFNGSQLLGTADVSNDAWTLSTTLANGTYNNLHATATDEAGNTADAGNSHVVTVSPASGYVIDGYIVGATVFADTNGNGVFDQGEASGTTDNSGHFVLSGGTTTGTLVLVGGIDSATGLPFKGVMTAPEGSTQVTPLSTLVQSVAQVNGGDVAAASQAVANALGLDPNVNLTTLDTVAAAYAGDSSAFVAASKVLNTVSMVASAVSGTGTSDFSSAASSAFSALASQIVASNDSNQQLDLSSSSVVSTVVNAVSSGTSLTSDQTADITNVVTSVNQATDQAVADSSGTSTQNLLTNVSATSIVAQGTTSTQLQQATSGATDLSTVVANNTGTNLTNSVGAAVSQVGSVAPAAPTFVSLTPTDGSPNNFSVVHYTLTFSDPVKGITASDFNIASTGLVGASIASITPNSDGTQYNIAVNTGVGVGDGSLTLSFTGIGVQDLAGNAFADQTTHAGTTYIVNQDTGEQAALALNVTSTQVSSAGSAVLHFTIAGLEPNDTGTVTFTDGSNKVTVAVSGAQTSYTANLSTLTDGTITSSLAVNTDAAGNSFTAVNGTSAVALSGFNVAGNPIQVIQNGAGDITIIPNGNLTAQSGDGVIAEQSASGTGNVTVNAGGHLSGQGTGSIGVLAENLNAANAGTISVTATGGASGAFDGVDIVNQGAGNITVEAGGAIAGTAQFGIRAEAHGTGSISLVTDAGSSINSGGAGISAASFATSIAASANNTITVTNNATISSGTTPNPSGSAAQGIAAGYYGANGTANTNINGTVTVNNNGNITAAAGYGVDAYSYGNGNVTLNEGAGTSVSGAQYGIAAYGNSFGSGNIAVNVGANATISGGSVFGIQAFENEVGSVSVTLAAGDSITGGSSGINVQSQAASDDATSSVTVIAHGTIHSGTGLTPNGSTPGGIVAGYSPNGVNQANGAVAGNVLVQSDATIVAAAGSGINAYNYGSGNVTVTTGATSSITGATSGNQANGINANALDGGNVSVTNGGSVTGGTGIFAGANHAGTISLENDGQITATAFSGINVSQASAGSTGSATITNTGSVVGAAGHSAINVNENAAGTVTINNSGIIGAVATAATVAAITENGGASVIINNSGQIDGNIFTNNTGGFTGTLNNNAGASWQSGFIDDEGSITATGAGSTISVLGNSTGMTVGSSGTGRMTIAAAAALTADFVNIGFAAGSHGTVDVTGAGTTLNTTSASGQYQNIGVGFDGTASLTIADHAVVTTGNLDVASNFDAGVTDTLVVDNATLNAVQGLGIANGGTANATVQNGGSITTGFLSLAGLAGSSGSLTVTGAGSVVSAGGLGFGSGSATLNVSNGGAIDIGSGTSTVAGAVHIGSSASLVGTGTINGNVVDDGNITAFGLLDIDGILSGSGSININDGGTLELAGSGAESIYFAGGNDTLQLDNALGFTGTISGNAGSPGNFYVTDQGNVTTTAGDAIDFNSAGGAVGSQANVIVTTAGTITGAATGIDVVQNGVGDITISPSGSVTGQSGDGVIAEQSASGTGNVTVNAGGHLSGQGTGSIGVLAENLNAANAGTISVTATGGASGAFDGVDIVNQGAGNITVEAGGAIAGTAQFGIRAEAHGTGSISLVTDAGSSINSGGAGISAASFATSIAASANNTITVTNNATISSGTTPNPSGSAAQGIAAGYYGANGTANTNINGTVTVNNNGNITAAAGYGVDAYSYGNGNVTLNEGAGTSVSGAQYGIAAYGNSFGSGNIAVNVGANATISGGSVFGIQAFENEVGSVSVTLAAGDSITGGSSGINVQSQAASDDATSSVTVIAHGTIHSGTGLTPNGSTPGGIVAGYSPNGVNQANGAVAGNVLVQSDATIVAAAGSGINAYNYGSGNVTVTTGATSSITGATSGNQANGINANALDGGNVSVTNGGSVTGGTGIFAGANHAGTISLENDGQITATAFSGINVSQASAGSTGSATITNTGSVVGAAGHSAINVNENAAGTVTINNSGIIGAVATAATVAAITENGGASVIINNSGQIDGNIFTNNTGGFTGTLNNNAGASWQSGFIDDEGSITATGAGSTISVLGNSTGMTVGSSGTGRMTIAAAAALTADFVNIGFAAGSHGTVDVTGAGTTLNTTSASGQYQNIGVGFDGTASLTIADHAVVTTGNLDVAAHYDAGVTDTFDINDASLITQGITIGDAGTGNATVENGGSLTASFLSLASQTGSTGSLTVDGPGSVVTTAGMALGSGSATLTVTHGGAIDIGAGTTTVAGAVHIGSSASLGGAGTINGNVVDDGNVTVISGTLDINGAVSGAGSLTVGTGAHLEFGSTVTSSANVQFQGSTGSIIIDHSAGFAGLISGFTGDGTLAGSDQIDLKDINYGSGSFSETFDAVHDTLSVSDGTNSTTLHFTGTYVAQNFSFASDGAGGTIVYDPPVKSSSGATGSTPNAGQGPAPAGEPGGGDSFHFGNLDHYNAPTIQSLDLPQSHENSVATSSYGPQTADTGPGAMEGLLEHDHMPPAGGVPNGEMNWAHFHLV